MLTLSLIGIGCGDPEQLTRAAVQAINAADLILIPRKGTAKSDLADLRRTICADVLTNQTTRIAEFDLPVTRAWTIGTRPWPRPGRRRSPAISVMMARSRC